MAQMFFGIYACLFFIFLVTFLSCLMLFSICLAGNCVSFWPSGILFGGLYVLFFFFSFHHHSFGNLRPDFVLYIIVETSGLFISFSHLFVSSYFLVFFRLSCSVLSYLSVDLKGGK